MYVFNTKQEVKPCIWLKFTCVLEEGLVLRRFVLRRFTFTTPVESDRAIPTCGASLSQFTRPFST